VIHPLRAVKSPEELDRIRRVAHITCDAFDELTRRLRPGETERDVYRALHGLLVAGGADKVPYLVPVSGPGGYAQLNMGPSDRCLASGDVLYVDVGATWRGYFCDFDRNFSVGPPSDEVRRAYDCVYEATEAGLAALRPGCTTGDVWRAMAAVVDPGGQAETPVGRMGHGVGMSLTEPPSIAPSDPTKLEEGMVLALEPSLMLSAQGRSAPRLMVHEENLVVTREGYELLTRRASPVLPVV
jgi:Xaa-Pro aminopeptidase